MYVLEILTFAYLQSVTDPFYAQTHRGSVVVPSRCWSLSGRWLSHSLCYLFPWLSPIQNKLRLSLHSLTLPPPTPVRHTPPLPTPLKLKENLTAMSVHYSWRIHHVRRTHNTQTEPGLLNELYFWEGFQVNKHPDNINAVHVVLLLRRVS